MADPRATILSILSAGFEENSYLAQLKGREDCLVIDPGLEPGKIIQALEEKGWTPAAILCTHGHADHIAGNTALKDRWPNCPLVIGAGDADKLTDPVKNLSAGYGINLYSPPADRTVREGEALEYAGFRLDVRDTPGHSSGHVVFIAHELSPVHVFGGDVLFAGSIGRTDFPDGSFAELRRSIHEKLFPLPDDTIVLPGHGPPTTIGEEKRCNPFVGLDSDFQG
jgi:glyoxylase-like metal-dependent hydrolase (beta-lactamase superfamily II)